MTMRFDDQEDFDDGQEWSPSLPEFSMKAYAMLLLGVIVLVSFFALAFHLGGPLQ